MKKFFFIVVAIFFIISFVALSIQKSFKEDAEKEARPTILLVVDQEIDEDLKIVLYHPVYWGLSILCKLVL